jgi:hypothetical protein
MRYSVHLAAAPLYVLLMGKTDCELAEDLGYDGS